MMVRWHTGMWRPFSFVTVNSHTELEWILQISLSMMRAVPLGAMICSQLKAQGYVFHLNSSSGKRMKVIQHVEYKSSSNYVIFKNLSS